MWTAIVCTCQNGENANWFRRELQIRKQKGLISADTAVLAVGDPKPNIGSGSAALNAFLCVAEHLTAQAGQTVVSGDVLYNARILVLLLGTTFPFSPCGHAFMPYPSEEEHKVDNGWGLEDTEVKMNMDRLLEMLSKLCAETPPGVWIASTDMILKTNGVIEPMDLTGLENSIGVLTVLANREHAKHHGVCRVTDTGEFAQIMYKPHEQVDAFVREEDGKYVMLTGIAYLSPQVAEVMMDFHAKPPLDACTYVGLDNGAQPLSLSLFFDIFQCLTTEISKEDFICGKYKSSSILYPLDTPTSVLETARSLLWKALRGKKMMCLLLRGVEHNYLQNTASDILRRYSCSTSRNNGSVVINSITDKGVCTGNNSVIINSELKSMVHVGDNCFISGLTSLQLDFLEIQTLGQKTLVPDNMAMQEIRVSVWTGRNRTPLSMFVMYGVQDNHDTVFTDTECTGTFCNKSWKLFFERTGIQPFEIWPPSISKRSRCLFNAKLYPVSFMGQDVGVREVFWLTGIISDHEALQRWRASWRISLADIMSCVDCKAEFVMMRDLSFKSQRKKMVQALQTSKVVCFLPFFKDCLFGGKENEILATLDEVVEQMDDPLVISRVYACIADVLGFMVGEGGGIRAGPAANLAWRNAFTLLERREFKAATKALAAERANWMTGGPDRIIRASRHYERAGHILTRLGVATALEFKRSRETEVPSIGQVVMVTAPARIDIAGAWSDTPPQTYEWGGVVLTVAINVEGQHPIRTRVKRIPEFKLVLVLGDTLTLECTELSDLADYSQPHAPGALLKAAFVCTEIVQFSSKLSLAEQLQTKYGSGFWLQAEANLPQGSGLGTSSILGGTILGALWRAIGQEHTHDSLVHVILYLEQLMTTGGGWQDQCGGLYGGVKLSSTERGLPVKITTELIDTPPDFLEKLNEHLLLIYTGKTRLARNLLQDVVRNWHTREPGIVQTMGDLVDNAKCSKKAFLEGDLAEIGKCLNRAQQAKLKMAPGSMPKSVTGFVKKIDHLIHGYCFCGAGGGGFLASILKEPANREKVQEIISNNADLNGFVIYKAGLDVNGITYSYSLS